MKLSIFLSIFGEECEYFLKDQLFILDIRYPIKNSYSFYLNYKDVMYRIDTAPHHNNLETFPNHCHFKQETNIIPDKWTNIDFDLEDNIKGIIVWLEHIFNQ